MTKKDQKPEKPPQVGNSLNPMIIMVNKEGRIAVEKLCHIALQRGGLDNYNGVTQVLRSLKPLPQPKLEKGPAEDK